MKGWMAPLVLLLLLSFSACKGCKKGGEGENPDLDDLVAEVCDNGDDDNEDGLTDCEQPVCQTADNCVFEPADPAGLAPPLDPSNLVGFADSVRFLWEGDDPIVRGVAPGAISDSAVAVLRAQVLDESGDPVAGIHARVAGQPQLGYTFSRSDGELDLVANGGSPTTIRVSAPGYLPVDRTIETSPRSFSNAPPMVLTRVSDKVTELKNGGLAVGDVTADDDGERTARIWFPKDTTATVHLPDGQRGDTKEFSVRMTEYTVGDRGPDAMPALLPDQSAYTYAVELSIDEAEALGADEVTFDKTGWLYLDNFLEFEVGQPVPSGYYSRVANSWQPEANGRVLQRVGDGVDIDGSGSEASKADRDEIGLSNDELSKIREVFADGETFWRVPVNHFSPYDLNWPYELPEGAVDPDEINIRPVETEEDPCAEAGSIIECQNQVMMKKLPLPGTPHQLVYRSDRTAGRLRGFELALTGDEVPSILQKVSVTVDIRGRRIVEEHEPPTPNLTFEFEWDGLDAYGREYQGETPIEVVVSHFYEAQFTEPLPVGAFGSSGGDAVADARVLVPLTRRYRGMFGSLDAEGLFNMGGWALDIQHAYNGESQGFFPATAPEIQRGNLANVIRILEGFAAPTGLPVEPTDLYLNEIGLYPTSDDGLFVMFNSLENNGIMIVKRHADGRLEHWAGTYTDGPPNDCFIDGECGEGDDPKDAILVGTRFAVGPDDTIYNGWGLCLREISPDGVRRVFGDCYEEPDEGDVDWWRIEHLAVGPNGEVYSSTGDRIYRVYPNSTRFDWLAGCPNCETPITAGADPRATDIGVESMVATPDGSIYFTDKTDALVRLRNGRLEPVALVEGLVKGIAAGPDSAVYIIQAGAGPAKLIRIKDGNVTVVAGGTDIDPSNVGDAFLADGIPATDAFLLPYGPPAVGRNGSIYMPSVWDVDGLEEDDNDLEPVIRVIESAFPNTVGGEEALLASPTGRMLYRFAPGGQLLDLRSSWNNLVLETLEYDDDGLAGVTDRDGRTTTIERDGSGQLAAIVGPYGQRTEFELDANGYIGTVTYPDSSTRTAEYTEHGLMTRWEDALGNASTYEYDSFGYLTRADDPVGGWKTLTRTISGVVLETASGRQSSFSAPDPTLGNATISTNAAGMQWRVTKGAGQRIVENPDGTRLMTQESRDPRFGAQSKYVSARSTTTPSGLEQVSERSYDVVMSTEDPTLLQTLTKSIVINDATTTWVYDADTHTTTSTSAEGRTVVYGFNDKNRLWFVRKGDFDPVELSYDDDGRLAQLTIADVSMTAAYDQSGYVGSITTADGTTSYTYDAVGRQLTETTPGGVTRVATYDAQGRPATLSFDGSSQFSFTHSGVHLPSTVTQPTGESDTFVWNTERRLAEIQRANGMSYLVQRDEADRVSGWTSGAGATTRTFDETTGQALRTETPHVTTDFRWDGFLMSGRDVAFEGQSHSIERTHDDNFRLVSRRLDGAAVSFGHDLDGRLTSAGGADVMRGTAGELNEVAIGGVTIEYAHLSSGQLESLTYRYNGSPIYENVFTYDAAGRRVTTDETIEGASASLAYSYDADGQLTEVTRNGTPEASFGYDARGNRTNIDAMAVTYDAADRVMMAGNRSYDVDASGYLSGWTDANGTTSVTLDGGNLLTAVTPTETIDYGYDEIGRRVWRRVDGAFDRGWVYDSHDRPIAEVDASGQVVSRFVYATSSIVPTYMSSGGQDYVFVTELNGSVRMVVDTSSGQVVQRLDYDALGNVLSDTNPGFQPFGFAGGLQDAATGLVRFGVRDYDPFVGRFISPEPRGFAGRQPNLFMFALNDPINFCDPHGDHWLLVVAAGGYVVYEVAVELKAELMSEWVGDVRENPSNQRAQQLAELHGLSIEDAENAMRHCTRGCDQVKREGPLGGEAMTKFVNWGHELGPSNWGKVEAGGVNLLNEGEHYYDSVKDEHTNEVAIACGSESEDCLENCARKLTNGELATDTPVAPDMSVDPGMSRVQFWVGSQ